jgi:hypothetical protein
MGMPGVDRDLVNSICRELNPGFSFCEIPLSNLALDSTLSVRELTLFNPVGQR